MSTLLGLFAFGCFLAGSAFFVARRICADRRKRPNGFVGRDPEATGRAWLTGEYIDDSVAGRK